MFSSNCLVIFIKKLKTDHFKYCTVGIFLTKLLTINTHVFACK